MSDSASEGSVSDLDCSAIIQDLDNKNTYDSQTMQDVAGSSQQKQSNANVHKSDPDVQAVINAQILDQLGKIGKCLDRIESKECKKTTDKSEVKSSKCKDVKSKKSSKVTEPPVKPLLQLKVDERLHKLSDLAKTGTSSKFKERGGSVEILIKNRVIWPHVYVLLGLNKERVTYDQLNVIQWVAGFDRTMRDESAPVLRKHMLEYLISIMDNVNNFAWTSAKASHAVLLCCMEQVEVKDYSDTLGTDRIRRANAQKHVPNTQSVMSGQSNGNRNYTKVTKSMPCTYYNQGSCLQTKSHETRGVLYKHICASCFATNGRTFSKLNKNKQFSPEKND